MSDQIEDQFERIHARLERIEGSIQDLKEITMGTQADVDAITTAIGQVEADLTSSTTAIQAELDALATANPSVDLTGLRSAVATLDPAVQAIGALKPSQPTPQPPAPGPGPTPGPPPPAA